MYIVSKGLIKRTLEDGGIEVEHCGKVYTLNKRDGNIWIEARYKPMQTEVSVDNLRNLGLVETTSNQSAILSRYWLFSRCVIVLQDCEKEKPLSANAMHAWRWFKKSPLHLTMAEFVRIMELELQPEPRYTRPSKRQDLVEIIYKIESIGDHILEHKMSRSTHIAKSVAAIEELLAKKYIYMI